MRIFTLCVLAIALALPTLAEARGGRHGGGGGHHYSRHHAVAKSHGHSTRRHARASHRPAQADHGGYGSRCDCGSGATCTGPRGGVYCITSGGNKRYF